jgi:hypothetical protein
VEQASFVPTGGQHWVRQLQIQIPESAESPGVTWWIVPLGPFARRRFPDIAVIDASGNRVNFVTRKQHGVALAKIALNKHLADISLQEESDTPKREQESLAEQYDDFRKNLLDFYTEMGDGEHRKETRAGLLEEYRELLKKSDVNKDGQEKRLKGLSDDLRSASETTQYLCWVQAAPGDVISLQVTYTTRDPKHKLEDGREGGTWGMVCALGIGLFGYLQLRKTFEKRKEVFKKRRETWNRWYLQFGLTPIPYVFNIPTHEYTASHYSTLEPPDNTYVAYLDWDLGNSRDSKDEVDSSLDATHIFNEESKKLGRRPTTHAYLRCAPHHHKQILGVALFNIALVWLLAEERFPNFESPIQGILVAAPSVLIAFLAQQQRHYYAHALRRSRSILWAYLFVEILFLVGVTFSHAPSTVGSRATYTAWALAISSVMLLVWQFPLGRWYDRVVNHLTDRKQKMALEKFRLEKEPRSESHAADAKEDAGLGLRKWIWHKMSALRWDGSARTLWQCYEVAVEQWARWMRRFILCAGLGAFAFLCWKWPPKEVTPTLLDGLAPIQKIQDQTTAPKAPSTTPVTHSQPPPAHPTPTGNRQESRGP